MFQLQLGRERDGVPQTRDYIGATKDALRAREAQVIERLLASTEGAF